MTALTEAFVAVRPDMDKFEPEVKKKLKGIDTKKEGQQVATRFGVGFNGAFGGIISRSAGIFAAGFAAIKGAQVFGGFIKDAAESAKISRITANAIRATGGAAKISADQVSALATSISNKTAIDDEQIQSAANMLLTFKNIRNEAGKNNDIFNQATQAAADLSVQFGGIDGASKQLGKALNDPVKGTTALAKAGVTFTDQQKKQIKTLVESGNVLGAQKIILKEIQGQVGGAAAAAADPMQRLKVIAGNLGEEIGGLLLPTVNRFANFISDTAVPGLRAFGAAFQGEGITSDGFVGVMERIGVAARSTFGFFKTEVLPRLREFAGFVTATVVPAVGGFATNIVTSLAPAVKDTFGFFKTEVLPRLKEFAGFVSESVLPKVGELATSFSKNKDFLVPFVAILAAAVVGFKAFMIIKSVIVAVAAFNAVLMANPIGLVVVAIAALAAGLIWAYKNSETFRKIVNSAFTVVKTAGSIMWTILKPVFWFLGEAFKVVWGRAQLFWRITVAAFNAIKEPAKTALKYVVDAFLGFVESILTGASKAFGWVPELGGNLKKAASDFSTFRDDVNNKLNGIKDQSVTIKPVFDKNTMSLASAGRRAMGGPGGPVHGPGSTTSDRAGLYALSNKEWVIRASSSMKYGDRAMAAVNAGRATVIPDGGFAAGGSPGFTVRTPMPNTSQFAREVAAHSVQIAKPFAQQIAKQLMGPGGPPGARQSFRGVTLNERTVRMLLAAERLLGRIFHITQGSYSTRVAASGSTHAGGGAMDVNGPGGWGIANSALHRVGFASWIRLPSQGPWRKHIHAIAIGDPSASPAAKAQVRDFLRGGNGLRGMALGGKVVLRDNGGPVPPGWFGFNGTSKTETMLTAEQAASRGRPIIVENHIEIGGEVVRVVRTEIDGSDAFAGTRHRMGAR